MKILLFVLFVLFGAVFCASIRDPLAFIMRTRTNKHLLVSLFLGLWLCACRPVATVPAVPPSETLSPSRTPAPPTPTAAFTPTASPTASLTPTEALPSATPAPWLASVQYEPWALAHAVAWSADGRWLAAAAGEQVYIYEGATLAQVHRLETGAWAVGLAFAPQPIEGGVPLLAAAVRDGTLQLWDAASGERLASHPAHPKGANSVAFSPDGLLLASTGNDALVRIWHTALLLSGPSVEPVAVMIGGAVAVPAIRFSPDGGLVASIDLQAVRLRDPQTTRLVRSLRSEASMFTLAFSPDGTRLAAGEMGGGVRLWDVATGEQVMLLEADPGTATPTRRFVWSLAFSPEGTLLAAGSSGGTITLWSMPAGDILRVIPAHSKAVSGLAFDPQGLRLASCGLDAAVRVWEVGP